MNIGMLIFPEFQLLDVAGPLEVFGQTQGLTPLLIAATTNPIEPNGWPHVRFTPDYDLASAPAIDVLFVPGGSGIRYALEDEATLAWVAQRGAAAKYITSVCTGALVLGAAGLLRGYRAATHWLYMDLLRAAGAEPVDERVVRDRNRITSGGVTAGIDFGLELAAELTSPENAQRAQLYLQYAPAPPFNAGDPSTAPPEIVAALREASAATFVTREKLLRERLK